MDGYWDCGLGLWLGIGIKIWDCGLGLWMGIGIRIMGFVD